MRWLGNKAMDLLIYLASRRAAPRIDRRKTTDQFTTDSKVRASILDGLIKKRDR